MVSVNDCVTNGPGRRVVRADVCARCDGAHRPRSNGVLYRYLLFEHKKCNFLWL